MLDTYFTELFLPNGSAFNELRAWRPLFDNFVFLGGSGATMGLIFAVAITVKDGPIRQISKFSIVPGIFNINETVLYGLPVILNPRYLIPFICIPFLLTLLTLGAVQIGFIELLNISITWTTPPLISGWLLTGSWHGVVWQLFELTLCTILYLPFVKRAEAQRISQQCEAFRIATDATLSLASKRIPTYNLQTQTGLIARGLLSDLKQAIEMQHLKLAYQPKHALDGTIVGTEALLRWHHPRHGQLAPTLAITLAEDSGDIHALGLWVIEQACACKARWNNVGFKHLVMAVNVSPMQLSNNNLCQQLADILTKYQLSAEEIELEITESNAIPATSVVNEVLSTLSHMGFKLAMDDFGMGASSLLHLRRFKVNAIKIDGSLTRDVLSNQVSVDIIRTIATLGQTQQVAVVAEYVETEEQRALLVELGCNYFQGYLYSRALYEPEATAYLKNHHAETPNPS